MTPTTQPGCQKPYAAGVSWFANQSGWLLERQECSHARVLRSRLYLTTDAGHVWRRRHVPVATGIAFASDRIGYAFGNGRNDTGGITWMTRNGARSWRQLHGRATEALVVAGRWVYRVTFRGSGCPGPCRLRIERARIGSLSWRTVDVPPYSGDGARLAASGRNVVVSLPGNPAGGAPSAHTSYLLSSDSGKTWHTADDPCGGTARHEWDTAVVALHHASVAALCASRVAQRDAVVISHDFGMHWTSRRQIPIRWPATIGLAGSNALIGTGTGSSAGAETYVVDSSMNGGTTWERAITAPSSPHDTTLYVAADIECAGNGCAVLASPHLMFMTRDGGRAWAAPKLPS